MTMKRVCYAAPTTIVQGWVRDLEAAGYEKNGDNLSVLRLDCDGRPIFKALEIKKGFWAAVGDDEVITLLDNEDGV